MKDFNKALNKAKMYNIKDLVLDKGKLEKINRKSLTPNEPIKIAKRFGDNNTIHLRVIDGHHRIKEALDRKESRIKGHLIP